MNAVSMFDTLLDKISDERLKGKGALSILGGRCTGDRILRLVEIWPRRDQMPYCIWEYSHEIQIARECIPDDYRWLERGRLFGAGGDLSVRRISDEFRWWFVGPAETNAPDGFECDDFWAIEPASQFYVNEEGYLLWGKHTERGGWFDDRVARAPLIYRLEDESEPDRVKVICRTYSRAGRVEFVWLHNLIAWKKEGNEG
jgi:hypothetical protein